MIVINNKQMRNLEEQVGYLTSIIGQATDVVKNVVGIVANAADLPAATLYAPGTTFAVGAESPYHYYVDLGATWLDLGTFPQAGPAGANGTNGYSIWSSNAEVESSTTVIPLASFWNPDDIAPKAGDLVVAGNWLWKITDIIGDEASVLIAMYLKGRDGTSFTIIGSVATAADLPVIAPLGTAYFVGATAPRDVYVRVDQGGTDVWENEGSLEGPAGPQGPQGPAGSQGIQGPAGAQGPAGSALDLTNLALFNSTTNVQYSDSTGVKFEGFSDVSDNNGTASVPTDLLLPLKAVDGLIWGATPTNELMLMNNKAVHSLLVVAKPNGSYALRIQFKDLSYVESPIITPPAGMDRLALLTDGIENYNYDIVETAEDYIIDSILTATDIYGQTFNVNMRTKLPLNFRNGFNTSLEYDVDGKTILCIDTKYVQSAYTTVTFDDATFTTTTELTMVYEDGSETAPVELSEVDEHSMANLDSISIGVDPNEGDGFYYGDYGVNDQWIQGSVRKNYIFQKDGYTDVKTVNEWIEIPLAIGEGLDASYTDPTTGRLYIQGFKNMPIQSVVEYGHVASAPTFVDFGGTYTISLIANNGYMANTVSPSSYVKVVGCGDYTVTADTAHYYVTIDCPLSPLYIKATFENYTP